MRKKRNYIVIYIPDEIDETYEASEKADSEKEKVKLMLGKMRVQDIAYELSANVQKIKVIRKQILENITLGERNIILEHEALIEKLRNKILSGRMKKRRKNHSFGVEGLVRGIVRELINKKKSAKMINIQTGLELSTIYYHIRNIENGNKRKYPPRLMNMTPNKSRKIKRLLEQGKKQSQIIKILHISSATASTQVKKLRERGII